jgi:hypothetical protein
MPHHIRPLAVSLLLTLAAIGCAPTCVADGNGNVTIVDDENAATGNADTGEPVECGGMCNPAACPKGTVFSGPATCQCIKPSK